MPAAVQFAAEVTAYLNETHALNMKFGVELFGGPSIHWNHDFESVDKSVQLNATLRQDRAYLEMLNKARVLWLEGSAKDTIVTLMG